MKQINRRDFVRQSALAGMALMATPALRAAEVAKIEVLTGEPIGTISPDIYGHFTEHIGGVIYDGIWVGEDSKIPNIGGIRKDLVDYLRRIKPPVVRWPGGCFADSYNWRNGIGPRDQRPRRTNFWINDGFMAKAPDGPEKYEPNQFGTNEFIHFCRLIGAQPYLAANVRSATARDFYDWVEYCNSPAGKTTFAEQRASNGDPAPFNVRFWGVGNESWGCGGNMRPEEYAAEFRKFTAWVPNYGQPLAFIGAGPSGGDLDWTRRFFARLVERDHGLVNSLYGWAMHYYCGTAGGATKFSVDEWYQLLTQADEMEALIQAQWSAMGEIDKQHRVKLVVDEWGAWHHPGTEAAPTHLFGQTSSLRDALISGLTLDTFNRHADKVTMTNVAQLINNLHSLFLAREEKFVATPNFYVFEMYAAHQGGKSLRTVFEAPKVGAYQDHAAKLPGLAGSASLHDRKLVLTVVNPHANEPRAAEIAVRGATVKSAAGQVITADALQAHNTFEHPEAVVSRDTKVKTGSAPWRHEFPPASITRLTLELG